MIMRETGVGGERGVNNRKVELRLVGGGGGGCNDDFRDRSDFVDRVNEMRFSRLYCSYFCFII